MIIDFLTLEELNTAWRRIKFDLRISRHFIDNTELFMLIDHDSENLLKNFQDELVAGNWSPRKDYVADIPKGNGEIRPAVILPFHDMLIYYALVGICYPYIHKATLGNKNEYSYILPDSPNTANWIKRDSWFKSWSNFRVHSLNYLESGIEHVVITDIVGYYENISINRLNYLLNTTNIPHKYSQCLCQCLKEWAISERGIPQGYSPSDMLAKLYLFPVDEELRNLGITHMLYVDDFRIFSNTKPEANKAFLQLIKSLRRSGLNIKSNKSGVYNAKSARDEIASESDRMERIVEAYKDEVKEQEEIHDDYFQLSEADNIVENRSNDKSPLILEKEFVDYFLTEKRFNKTLFHFIIKRLGSRKNEVAIDYCLELLTQNPQETGYVLSYFSNLIGYSDIENKLYDFISSNDSIYRYQQYLILDWILKQSNSIGDNILNFIRNLLFNENKIPRYMRGVCRKLLAKKGGLSDYELILDSYDEAKDDYDKSEILYSIRNMNKIKRNEFYSKRQSDGLLCQIAVDLAKQEV